MKLNKRILFALGLIIFILLIMGYQQIMYTKSGCDVTGCNDSIIFERAFIEFERISDLIKNSSLIVPDTIVSVRLDDGKASFSNDGITQKVVLEGEDLYSIQEGKVSARFLHIYDSSNNPIKHFFILFKYEKEGDKVSVLGYKEIEDIKNISRINAVQNLSGTLVFVSYSKPPKAEYIENKYGIYNQVYRLEGTSFILDNEIYRKVHPS
ncbi:MAG: hypothetical protein Q7R58_02770 [bacterium]|nr:hypothetical protein [bacterium]